MTERPFVFTRWDEVLRSAEQTGGALREWRELWSPQFSRPTHFHHTLFAPWLHSVSFAEFAADHHGSQLTPHIWNTHMETIEKWATLLRNVKLASTWGVYPLDKVDTCIWSSVIVDERSLYQASDKYIFVYLRPWGGFLQNSDGYDSPQL